MGSEMKITGKIAFFLLIFVVPACCSLPQDEAATIADSADCSQSEEILVYRGMSDASAAVAVGEGMFIAADDENNVLRVYKIRGADLPVFQYDLTHPMVVGATVTFVALQLAYYMGFQTVYLIGLDHNYKEKGIPSKTETRAPDQDESHFHKNYFPKGYKWQLPDLLRSEIEFDITRKAFEADGRDVLDATIGGKCQIFKKVSFEDIFN